MPFWDAVQILVFVGSVIVLTPMFGQYMANIFTGKITFSTPILGWLERVSYRMGGVNPNIEMTWTEYAKALFIFNLLGFFAVFFILLYQNSLPLNPQHYPDVHWKLAFNIAMSFVTNTNWQSYAGETTLSNFTQMFGLTTQNFLSAATGMGSMLVLIRGLIRKSTDTIGNFWVDLTRSVVYIFLPLSIIMAFFLVSEGVIQTFSPNIEIMTLENEKQIIPLGPVASQVAIKQLGTNGGGFFNANSAHPFENPTPLTNFIESLSLVLIPAALTYTFGTLINSRRRGWLMFFVMGLLWIVGYAVAFFSETMPDPVLGAYPVLEGIETRIGTTNSLIWTIGTTGSANGSVNAMISSLSPLVGGVAMFNIMLGELIFGGIGVGLSSMVMYIILTIFICGLMVGRTPEYLGKKIEQREMKWVTIAILLPGALILIGAGISCMIPDALSSLSNQGPHGFSEVLYAFTSASGNNGSSFSGFNANTDYYNLVLGSVMFFGRLSIVVPSLAIGGLLAKKKITPPSIGTFTSDNFLFVTLKLCIILIVGALSFFPALSLGPIIEQILMLEGKAF